VVAPAGVPETVSAAQGSARQALDAWRERRARSLGEHPDGPWFHLAVATATLATASMLKQTGAIDFTAHRALWHLAQATRAVFSEALDDKPTD